MNRSVLAICLLAVLAIGAICAAGAAVDLEWRPAYQSVRVGQSVNLGLYAASDSGSDWPMAAMDVVVLYDPAYLHFYNITSAGAPYQWFLNGFFSPSPDNINVELDDGDAMYTAWAKPGVPAMATPRGLLVTTFKFSPVAPGCGEYVTIAAAFGTQATTRVFDGTVPNTIVTGRLGAARVMIVPLGVLTSVVEAKAISDGTVLEVGGPIATRTFGDYFYVEDFDRTAGIKVNCDPSQLPAEGTAPRISGTIRTVDGERVIDQAVVTSGCAVPIPGSLSMHTRAIRTGLSPTGLLIKVAGTVMSVSPGGQTFTLGDGAETSLRVELHGVSAPPVGGFVTVTGALGADLSGPVLRVNNSDDIKQHP